MTDGIQPARVVQRPWLNYRDLLIADRIMEKSRTASTAEYARYLSTAFVTAKPLLRLAGGDGHGFARNDHRQAERACGLLLTFRAVTGVYSQRFHRYFVTNGSTLASADQRQPHFDLREKVR
jgi:hypothetical protein